MSDDDAENKTPAEREPVCVKCDGTGLAADRKRFCSACLGTGKAQKRPYGWQ